MSRRRQVGGDAMDEEKGRLHRSPTESVYIPWNACGATCTLRTKNLDARI
jgi:hypothetical protein